jgi:hypothetical protein
VGIGAAVQSFALKPWFPPRIFALILPRIFSFLAHKRDVQHAEHPQNPPDTLRATATFAGGWSFGPTSR